MLPGLDAKPSREAVSRMLPSTTQSATSSQLKNLIMNGSCIISQRASTPLTTTPTYGQCDRFMAWGTGTAVSAGNITRDTASPIGRTGNALKLSGVTITGTGVVLAKQRIESLNAVRLKNQQASFSVLVYHDVGSSINYTITIRKPTASDNYAGTTTIATGSATSVPTATGTQLTLANVFMGDCSNGIEVEVQAACGAVTTKNFSFTEWQLEEGGAVTSFERRDYGVEATQCLRYYIAPQLGVSYIATAGSQQVNQYYLLPVPMRTSPNMTLGTATVSTNVSARNLTALDNLTLSMQATSNAAGGVTLQNPTTASAEL